MKKITTLLVSLAFAFSAFCQADTTNNIPAVNQHKYKSLKSTAWALLAGGILLEGIAVATLEPMNFNMCLFCENQPPQKKSDDAVSTTLAIVGAGAIAASIPMFIIARTSKKKTIAVGYKQQHLLLPAEAKYINKTSQPAISLFVKL